MPRWAARLLGREGAAGALGPTPHITARSAATGLAYQLALGPAVMWPASCPTAEPVAGLAMVVAGVLLVGCAYVTARRRVARRRADLPLALHPKVSEVRLTERLGVDITLAPQGRYRTSLRPVEGDISVALVFGHPDRDRLDRYARKRATDRTSGSAQAAWSCTAPSTSRRSRTFRVLSADSRGPPGRIRCFATRIRMRPASFRWR